MCTIIPLRRKDKPSIAKKDIEVYKAGFQEESDDSNISEKLFISPYNGFLYTKDIEYRETFNYNASNDSAFDEIESRYRYNLNEDYTSIEHGFHALTKFDVKRFNAGYKYLTIFGRFIIPKGSRYFLNKAGCIVSETIIFKEFITKDYVHSN